MQHEYTKQDTLMPKAKRIYLVWLLDNASTKTHTIGSFLINFSGLTEQEVADISPTNGIKSCRPYWLILTSITATL